MCALGYYQVVLLVLQGAIDEGKVLAHLGQIGLNHHIVAQFGAV